MNMNNKWFGRKPVAIFIGCTLMASLFILGIPQDITAPSNHSSITVKPHPKPDTYDIEIEDMDGVIAIEIYSASGEEIIVEEFDCEQKILLTVGIPSTEFPLNGSVWDCDTREDRHSNVTVDYDSDDDTVLDADDVCPDTPKGAEVILSGVGIGCTPLQALQSVEDDLDDIIDNSRSDEVEDKLEDVIAKLDDAIKDLKKRRPDYEEVAGNIEGAMGDLEAAIKDKLLDRKQGSQLMDLLKAAKLNVLTMTKQNDD